MKSTNEMAIEILQRTNDGDNLDPTDLKFLEHAVNGFLNEAGEAAFRDLYNGVMSGYQKPWLHGIENLTINHSGYVYWKGIQVEHFNMPWAYSREGKDSAEETARRCRILEEEGAEISIISVIWKWPEGR